MADLGIIAVAGIAIAAKAQLLVCDFSVDCNSGKAFGLLFRQSRILRHHLAGIQHAGRYDAIAERHGFAQELFKFIFINFRLF